MQVIKDPADFQNYAGKRLGVSEWRSVDQALIDQYAELSGDHQWIHVDVERCKREAPGGKTIAHGYLVLSIMSLMAPQIWTVAKRSRALNYGLNKLRFTGTVPAARACASTRASRPWNPSTTDSASASTAWSRSRARSGRRWWPSRSSSGSTDRQARADWIRPPGTCVPRETWH